MKSKRLDLRHGSARHFRSMPNKDNVTRPILLIGAGRTSSSYVQDRLRHGLGRYHTVIENDLYKDAFKVLAESSWCFRYTYVGDEVEARRRIVSSIRDMFSTLFASDLPGWSMKCIWDNHDADLLHELFSTKLADRIHGLSKD